MRFKGFTLELPASFYYLTESSLGSPAASSKVLETISRMGRRELRAWTLQLDCLGLNLRSSSMILSKLPSCLCALVSSSVKGANSSTTSKTVVRTQCIGICKVPGTLDTQIYILLMLMPNLHPWSSSPLGSGDTPSCLPGIISSPHTPHLLGHQGLGLLWLTLHSCCHCRPPSPRPALSLTSTPPCHSQSDFLRMYVGHTPGPLKFSTACRETPYLQDVALLASAASSPPCHSAVCLTQGFLFAQNVLPA